MTKLLKLFVFFILLIAIPFFSGCVGLLTRQTSEKSGTAEDARNLLSVFQDKNSKLKTFKGIGKIRIWNKNISQTLRIAWLGEEPEKLRIGIMSIAGQPAASAASNGQTLYFVSHVQQQFYKKEESDPNLSEILSLPIKFRDIIAMLRGGIPMREFHSLLLTTDPSDNGYVLVLKRRWGNILEKIFLDESKTRVLKVELFEGEGLSYRAEFDDFQNIKGFQIPFTMKFSNNADEGFQLQTERYWSNIGIAPSKFVLNPLGD